jgi:hypothetical protein
METIRQLSDKGLIKVKGISVSRIAEGHLRRIIRAELLSEAMMTPELALDRGIKLQVREYSDLITITAVWYNKDEDEEYTVGVLWAEKPDHPCLGAWEIRKSKVADNFRGLGPLLYDLMIDLVSPDPLVSDRQTVRPAAKRVWDHYMSKRPDVGSERLDNQYDERTPGYKEDNCDYTSALEWSRKDQPWYETSLARAYKGKGGKTLVLNDLRELGLITFVET